MIQVQKLETVKLTWRCTQTHCRNPPTLKLRVYNLDYFLCRGHAVTFYRSVRVALPLAGDSFKNVGLLIPLRHTRREVGGRPPRPV
jgi:hypothetical protein